MSDVEAPQAEPKVKPNLLDKVVSWISPQLGYKRMVARELITNHYDAAESNSWRKRNRGSSSVNAVNARGAQAIKSEARRQEENYEIAVSVLDILVNNVVGSGGLVPDPQVKRLNGEPHTELNTQIRKIIKSWSKRPEVTGKFSYGDLQRLMVRTWFRDGEVFCRLLAGRHPELKHSTKVPFSIEAFESDFIPFDNEGQNVQQGVHLNRWGRAVAYNVYSQHPGDLTMEIGKRQKISASQIVHLMFTRRLHAVRGISVFHAVLNRIEHIDELDEAENIAARMAAMFALAITRGDAGSVNPQSSGTDPDEIELTPGLVFKGQPGEQFTPITNGRPNLDITIFRDSQGRTVAAGTGVSASNLNHKYDNNYSSQRQERSDKMPGYRALSKYFINQCLNSIYAGLIDAAIKSGQIMTDRTVDLSTIYDATHSLPLIPHIDPDKETKALERMEEREWMAKSDIISMVTERTPDEVETAIREDRKRRAANQIEPAANQE